FWIFAEPLVGIIGRDEETIAFGADYLRVASTSMSFTALSMVASRTLLAANDSWSPMVVRAGGALLNIGLNAVFIFVLDLGVVGAALGTVISDLAVASAFLWGLTRGSLPGIGWLPVKLDWSAPHWERTTARHLAKISTPLVLTNIGQHGGQFPMLAVVSLFGPQVVAAFVIALRIRGLMNTPGWGFGLASSSLVGQSLGLNREEEAGAYAQDALRFAVTVYVIAAAIVFVLADPVSRLFVSDPVVVGMTKTLLRVACLSVVLWGVMNGSLGPLRASGDTIWPFVGQMIGLFGLALPAAYLGAVTSLGLAGLYLALLLETGVPAAVTYYRFRSNRWKLVSRAYRPAA